MLPTLPPVLKRKLYVAELDPYLNESMEYALKLRPKNPTWMYEPDLYKKTYTLLNNKIGSQILLRWFSDIEKELGWFIFEELYAENVSENHLDFVDIHISFYLATPNSVSDRYIK